MTPPVPATDAGSSEFKSRGGLARVWRAVQYSRAGLAAAVRHEAAFRQELALGVPMVLAAPWLAPTALHAVALVAVVVLVWIVELLNSAVEAVADAVSAEHHPLIGRAKDFGSAAVMLSLLLAGLTWAVVLGSHWLR
ncbi:MAG: diacylglycerol kinase [Rubrivivax sp.]|nr:diacylglycerol kinase [Rubrivivax sp.]